MAFQTNTTIQTALWMYKPDPATDPTGKQFLVNLNLVQYIETSQDHKTVWLYFAETNVAGTQDAYQLKGAVAQAFMTDLEVLFA
jgi:hypothetical protein